MTARTGPAEEPELPVEPRAFVHEHVAAWARRTPLATALAAGARRVSYAELERRANRVAHRLRALGVGPERVVGLWMGRSVDLVVAILGTLKAGGAFLPLDPAWPGEWIAPVVSDGRVCLVLAQQPSSIPGWNGPVVSFEITAGADDEGEAGPPSVDLLPGNPAYALCTSGSSGPPKVVLSPHARTPMRDERLQAVYRFDPGDRHLLKSATGFTLLVREVFWPLRHGAMAVVVPADDPLDPSSLAHWVSRERISIVSVVPSMLRALLEEPAFVQAAALRHVVCFGEALDEHLRRHFLDRHRARLSVNYGTTEAPSATFAQFAPGDDRAGVVIGQPLPGREVLVLGPDLAPVRNGVSGEIFIGGKLARGYASRPGQTAERFVPHPRAKDPGARLYRTGDRARVHPDGSLEYLGRADDQAVVRGARIEPAAVESILASHACVREAAVAVRDDARGQRSLVAWVVCAPGPGPDAPALRAFLRERLPDYMVPDSYVTLDQLPRLPGGKLDRRALQVPARSPAATEGPRDEFERQVAVAWRAVLGAAAPGRDDDFFDHGGNSLLAVTLLARIEHATGVRIGIAEFMDAPEIAGLARRVRAGAGAVGGHGALLVPLRQGGNRAPLFFVPGGGGGEAELVGVYRLLADGLDPDQPLIGLRAPGDRADEAVPGSVEELACAFVAEIRATQPAGPYFLGGECLGGVVAYETARQLAAAGGEVALLLLLESYPPAAGDERRARVRMRRRARNRQRSAMRHWLGRTRYWLGRASRAGCGQWTRLLAHAVRGARAALQARALEQDQQRQRLGFQLAVSRYRPGPYPGQVTLVVPADNAGTDPDLGWGRHAGGGVIVHRVPGDHYSYVREHAATTAARVQDCLAGAARRAPARAPV